MKRNGFTLIELLVAMTIIAVLTSLALVSYQGAKRSARDGQRKADLAQIKSALEMCYTDTDSYPASIYTSVSCSGQTYLQTTPQDPKTGANYSYSRPTGTSYTLCTQLETTGENYCVSNP